jgi:hypothetical protein
MATDENDLTPAKPVKAKLAKKKLATSKSIVKKKAIKPAVKKKAAKPVAKKKELASAIENTMEKNQAINPVPKKKAVKPVLKNKAVVKKAVLKKAVLKKEMKVASGKSPTVAKIKALKDHIDELNQELTDLKTDIKLTKKRENATALLAKQREVAANKFLRGWDKKANAALEKSLAIKKK